MQKEVVECMEYLMINHISKISFFQDSVAEIVLRVRERENLHRNWCSRDCLGSFYMLTLCIQGCAQIVLWCSVKYQNTVVLAWSGKMPATNYYANRSTSLDYLKAGWRAEGVQFKINYLTSEFAICQFVVKQLCAIIVYCICD